VNLRVAAAPKKVAFDFKMHTVVEYVRWTPDKVISIDMFSQLTCADSWCANQYSLSIDDTYQYTRDSSAVTLSIF